MRNSRAGVSEESAIESYSYLSATIGSTLPAR